VADAVVVGSALVDQIGAALDDAGRATPGLIESVLARVRALAGGVREAGRAAA
jgi:tryptophan synthase alpha chain